MVGVDVGGEVVEEVAGGVVEEVVDEEVAEAAAGEEEVEEEEGCGDEEGRESDIDEPQPIYSEGRSFLHPVTFHNDPLGGESRRGSDW